MSSATTTPINHVFSGRPDHTSALDRRDVNGEINALVLDYLTAGGYARAAASFAAEANLTPQQDDDSIRVRQGIQDAIHGGRIREAIHALNGMDPEILDANPVLHFSLLRLELVELIRECTASSDGDITPALNFAQTHLAPRAPTSPQFLEDLENTMALIVFPHDKLGPELESLLHPNLRREVADSVNMALHKRPAALKMLIRSRAWAEKDARETGKDLVVPMGVDLSLDLSGTLQAENGSEPMNTSF
ncbi:related to LisH motif-containing protein [Cephalotrichum gorgonifer]|uniref:Related to LisH motif-containing protein n=1 Tax=Cephalotrichum gorgonifer TaxID=2041049 RepID=A0AAE8MYS2_9PEZI|nr:related to LisH motif-containing protein [Cephalotrichum gorgonifer]